MAEIKRQRETEVKRLQEELRSREDDITRLSKVLNDNQDTITVSASSGAVLWLWGWFSCLVALGSSRTLGKLSDNVFLEL